MWSTSLNNGPDEQRWLSAPDNEIPVAVPLNVVLVRTEDIALAVLGVQAYSTGIAFTLISRVRPQAASRIPLHGAFWGHGGGQTALLLGIEFADGRRASSVGDPGPSRDGVILNPNGGSGGDTSVEQSWWLHPLPPKGALTLVVRCDALGIPETTVDLDGTAIRAAGEGALKLWPWTPPQPETAAKEPKGQRLPAESWFAT